MGNNAVLASLVGDIDSGEDFFRNEKATGTITCATVLEETKATGTLTMNGVTGEVHSSGTIVCASVEVGDTVTINGLVYTAVAGTKANDTEFDQAGTDTQCATDLADSIDDDTRSGSLNDLTATSSTDTVTAVQTVGGTGGDSTTLSSSDGTRLAVTSFTGGVNGDTVTINGLTYTATVGARADDTQFSKDTSNDATATDLAAAISADVRSPVTVPTVDVTATSSSAVVTLIPATVLLATLANSIDIVESTSTVRMTVSGATMASGVDADFVDLNGLRYKAVSGARGDDTEFSTDTSNTATATDLAAAITADVRTGTVLDVVATSASAVVTAEETIGGTPGNAITLTSTDGATLAVSAATLTGGTSPTSSIDFSVSAEGRTPLYVKLLIHAAESLTLSIAYNGSTFVDMKPDLVADTPTEFTIPVDVGDILNFRADADITLRKCKVIAYFSSSS